MSFLHVLRELKTPVWEHIAPYLKGRFPEAHYEILSEYPKRQGKYFRPALVILGAELFGGTREEAIAVAAAVQLSEDWLLVHDDVEDHSPLRRGLPSLESEWGDEIAINAGDALHILMWRLLHDGLEALPPERGREIFRMLNEVLLTTTEGQFLELERRRRNAVALKEEEYFAIVERKSARYSVFGPLALGALTAGAGKDDLLKLESWAMPFGLAFQVTDDILDLVGDTSTMGKEQGHDIIEGKPTLILAHCLRHTDAPTRAQLASIYEKPASEKTPQEVEWVRACFFREGSIAYAKAKAEALIAEAKAKFKDHAATLPGKDPARLLEEAMEFVTTRVT